MEYERKYQNRINWQNTPNMSTPLNATNLNKMDVALQYMDEKLAEASGDIVSIEANPSGTATSNLTKLKVDSTIYNVGSYTAGTGINIVNGVIQNTETGARSGIIDSISSSRAHTQIMLATNETFKAYETLILKSETSGSASTLRVQYASSASSVYDYNLYDTDGTTAKTLSLESGQIIIVMLDQTGYKAIVLSDGIGGGGGLPENPLSTAHGGTGNADGFIRTGQKSGTTIGTNATAEGYDNTASGNFSHVEGRGNTAGNYSHAEGYGTNAGAGANHAEGQETTASGYNCHAEGANTTSSNTCTHAEGFQTTASGTYSHAGGRGTVAGYSTQTAIGKWNDNKSDTLLEVGNGTSTNSKSNAFEVYSDGKISCDNGSSKFQFTQSGGVDGYNDASGTFHAFGGDSYALVGMGQVTSYSNKVADTNVYLHRAPKDGDRLFINFQPTITDSDAQIKIYNEASGTAYTLSFNFWASGSKLAGLCLLEVQDNGFGTLGLTLKYSFEGGTNYTAGAGIEINGSAISNTAPNYGVDVDGATISSVSSGNLGTYVGESKYLILYFSASASPYSGGYTLTLSYSGSVAIQEYGTLYDGSSRYNSNISAGTMLLCEVTDTGTGSSADPVHVNIIGKIDPNSGGGNTVSKTRYQISSSSWSSSANADGFYTLTATLNPAIGSSPDVYVAGSADGTQPTDTQKTQFSYLKRCKVNGSTLTLYASSKPSSTFYVWVEGVNGTGSGDIVGNIIQPNGVSSGGGEVYSTTETVIGTWKGQTLYRKVIEFGTLPNNGLKDVSTGFSRYAIKVVNTCVICRNSVNVNILIPFVSTSSGGAVINFRYDNNGGYLCAEIQTNFDATEYTECDVIMEYIKV